MEPNVIAIVTSDGVPVSGATVLAMFPDKTWKKGRANADGKCELYLYRPDLPMTVFVAGDNHEAQVKEWLPADHDNKLEVELAPSKASTIVLAEGIGYIPDLEGRLNPIRDSGDRMYLYATNIAINEGVSQPAPFTVGEKLSLRDANGHETTIRVMAIEGRASLIEYTPIQTPEYSKGS